jgi:hypothetical protein
MRKILLIVALALVAAGTQAQTPQGATISGYVTDSVSHKYLVDATVQLISDTDASFLKTATSDSLGRYTLTDVPLGKYKLGFLHPMLDSLGVEAPLAQVNVESSSPVIADIGIPSGSRLRLAICGKPATTDTGAVIVGAVRDAKTGAGIKGASVRGEWIEMMLNRGGFARRLASRTTTSADNGWFALCDVPSNGTVAVSAVSGSDSTGMIEAQVPADGFLRRELFVGSAGDGRVSGTITSVASKAPVEGAVVAILNGPETKTNSEGKFTITNAPLGTRMLEVRAIGYYPDRRYVNVVGDEAPVSISLSTLKAVLDTVKIMAKRLPNGPDDGGFLQRRKMGQGKYITAQDMLRFPVTNTSDVFRRIAGLRYELDQYGQPVVKMRGAFEEYCTPQIYLDGRNMTVFGGSTADIDDWVNPSEVKGIEVYNEATVPPQFTEGLHGCGAIVIWTK